MHEGVMKAWLESSHLGGGNMAYVDELYESYLAEPTSVGDEWREFFAKLPKIDGVDLETRHSDVRQQFADLARNKHREVVVVNSGSGADSRQVKVLQLINSYRFRGHQHANLDPLNLWKQPRVRDFANGAQVVIDQFLSSGEQKWGRLCGLTLLLPHGYEGQGPEHSSARLERFLQLCADHNMQICVPTTPAQVFNMLRRQMVRPMRRPLIVMSPKSLLRHPLATSTLEELASGVYHNVIGEIDELNPADVKRVVFCSGKVYYELLEERRKREQKDVAIVRVEQLYPFPHTEMAAALANYQHVTDFVWCQEEPQNQGAWYCSQHHFWAAIPKGAQLTYAGRDASSSPAVGYLSVHNKQQQALVNDALTLK
ncbi:2-oxoglutarate dehydrogenase E1 component [Alishewanella longhuensis]